MTEVETVEAVSSALVLPNGTVIDTENILEVVDAIRDLDLLKAQVTSARRHLVEFVMEERRRTGSSATMHVGNATITISAAREIVWDMETLGRLREVGLPESVWDELVTTTITEKVNATVATRIAKANDSYAAIIEAARTDHEKPPSVSVK